MSEQNPDCEAALFAVLVDLYGLKGMRKPCEQTHQGDECKTHITSWPCPIPLAVKALDDAAGDRCCDNERRDMNGGCLNCGDPCI